MTTTRYWITGEPWPASEVVVADAQAAGADVILHGIPATLADVIPAGVLGYYEIVHPDLPPFPPLDALGRMATLSAILHDDVEDWANASGYPVEHLIHEALAWEAASQP
jgi:hypothetical protein